MNHAPHSTKSDSIHGQCFSRVLAYASDLCACWFGVVARLMHQLIFPLQLGPTSALFRNARSQDSAEYAHIASICGTIHGEHSDLIILDLVPARRSAGEWPFCSTSVPADLQEYGTRTSSGETDNDRE